MRLAYISKSVSDSAFECEQRKEVDLGVRELWGLDSSGLFDISITLFGSAGVLIQEINIKLKS